MFENAEFDKPYRTYGGEKAVYITKHDKYHYLAVGSSFDTIAYYDNGDPVEWHIEYKYKIVSEWSDSVVKQEDVVVVEDNKNLEPNFWIKLLFAILIILKYAVVFSILKILFIICWILIYIEAIIKLCIICPLLFVFTNIDLDFFMEECSMIEWILYEVLEPICKKLDLKI